MLIAFSYINVYSQIPEEKDVYIMKDRVNSISILYIFDTNLNKCETKALAVGSLAELVYSRVLDDDTHIIVLSGNNKGENMAVINRYFCISNSALVNYFKKKEKPEVGILAIPFKFRIDPVKVMAGNTIGPFVGKKFEHSNRTSSILLGFASLTNVPLNDLNSSVPETRWGLGLGLGYVWTVSDNFQTGFLSGVDLFEGVEDWPYKFQPWISLSIGYTFTSTKKEEAALNSAR